MLSWRQSIPYIWPICQSHCPVHSELIPLAQVQYETRNASFHRPPGQRRVYSGGILAHVHRSLEPAGLGFGKPENPEVLPICRSFESARLDAPQVSARWARACRAMKKENRAQPRKLVGNASDPRVIAKSGRHKARRIILTENA